jgi:hypothetical protein
MIGLAAAEPSRGGSEKALARTGLDGAARGAGGSRRRFAVVAPPVLAFFHPGGGPVLAAVDDSEGWLLWFGVLLFAAGGGLAFGSALRAESVAWRPAMLAVVVIAVRFGVGDRLEGEFNRTQRFLAEVSPKVRPGRRRSSYPRSAATVSTSTGRPASSGTRGGAEVASTCWCPGQQRELIAGAAELLGSGRTDATTTSCSCRVAR